MKLSTKGRYATRAMLDLALHWDEGPVLTRDIAGREGISRQYLEQLFIPLRAAGLVRATRGPHGGFVLTRPPSQIKLSEIIQVMEGSASPVECVDDAGVCSRSELCVTREVWAEMKEAIERVLDVVTLQDLVDRQRGKERAQIETYQI